MEQIVIEKTILAKTVFLPWIPHWCPVQLASVHGIAQNLAETMTQNLLKKQFSSSESELDPFTLSVPGRNNTLRTDVRYVVYISRRKDIQPRAVENEAEVINGIRSALSPKYQLVVLGHSVEYQAVQKLQQSWQRYARIVNKAIVFIGPHGE